MPILVIVHYSSTPSEFFGDTRFRLMRRIDIHQECRNLREMRGDGQVQAGAPVEEGSPTRLHPAKGRKKQAWPTCRMAVDCSTIGTLTTGRQIIVHSMGVS